MKILPLAVWMNTRKTEREREREKIYICEKVLRGKCEFSELRNFVV